MLLARFLDAVIDEGDFTLIDARGKTCKSEMVRHHASPFACTTGRPNVECLLIQGSQPAKPIWMAR